MNITKCKSCGSENLKFEETLNTIHYGKMVCGHCNKFSHWVKNPNSQNYNSLRIKIKTIKDVCSFHRLNEERCFFCQRRRGELGAKETLTIDHIHELDKGGEDKIWNMQILCSACHKLKNWCRLYMNWHFKKEEKMEYDFIDGDKLSCIKCDRFVTQINEEGLCPTCKAEENDTTTTQ